MRVGAWLAGAVAAGSAAAGTAVVGAALLVGAALGPSAAGAVPGPSAPPAPLLRPAPATAPPSVIGAGSASVAVGFALSQLGTPYLWGGSGPGGWDCSGLVQAAYAAAGLRLTHNAAAQYAATAAHRVPLGALAPGDLVFFGSSPATIHHVGIVVDATHMVDAPHTGALVRVESLGWPDLLVATRPLAAVP
ncbi:MAG TPA: C40 family peptidase [Acidimicrobiales bacterium]|nr:C40 family peptidase [Acidimicrobiales bacterium]